MAVRLSAVSASRPLPLGRFLVLISVRGWVDPRAMVRQEGLGQLKNPIISSGIEILEKTQPSATLSITDPIWPGFEPGPPRWKASDYSFVKRMWSWGCVRLGTYRAERVRKLTLLTVVRKFPTFLRKLKAHYCLLIRYLDLYTLY
jgi:hypothetical protein